MSRRKPGADPGFGSDSFLDIIANIVGILIILIVVAGVRVSQAPVALGEPEEELEVDLAPIAPLMPAAEEKVVVVPVAPYELPPPQLPHIPEPEPQEILLPPPPKPIPPSPELLARQRDLERELKQLGQQKADLAASLAELSSRAKAAQEQIASAQQTVAYAQQAAEEQEQQIAQMKASLDGEKGKLLRLRFELERAEKEAPPVQTIRHKLTPLSKLVEGKEVHFQLLHNKVAYIPLDDLLDRLKYQVMRQKDWLVKFRRHEGSVGPVRGFNLEYVVERQTLSLVEELQHGQGMMRIGISEWRLSMDEGFEAETADQALRPGSVFHRVLMQVEPGSTLTFWVYPDSFELYQELQRVVREEDFTLAARPLPFGVPIAGSPNGTRSAGQ